jgi:CheY-like chemotaxis protein
MMPSKNNIRPGNILVADANADYRNLLCHYLEFLQYPTPIQARNGDEALSAALNRRPDLIVMELWLPQRTGFEIVARLRADSGMRHTRIVAATSMAMPGDREKCLAGGFDSYLAKPFTLKEFKQLLLCLFATDRDASRD